MVVRSVWSISLGRESSVLWNAAVFPLDSVLPPLWAHSAEGKIYRTGGSDRRDEYCKPSPDLFYLYNDCNDCVASFLGRGSFLVSKKCREMGKVRSFKRDGRGGEYLYPIRDEPSVFNSMVYRVPAFRPHWIHPYILYKIRTSWLTDGITFRRIWD